MSDTTCYDCSCYAEAVAMAQINIDQGLETWIDDVARSYGREVPLTIWLPAQEEPRS